MCGHGAGVERVDGQDVVDPAVGGVHDPGVQLAERAVPVVVSNDLDACHAPAFHTVEGRSGPADYPARASTRTFALLGNPMRESQRLRRCSRFSELEELS